MASINDKRMEETGIDGTDPTMNGWGSKLVPTIPLTVHEDCSNNQSAIRSFQKLIRLDKVCCLGAGYVGATSMAVIAQKCPELKVFVADISKERIKRWKSASNRPFYEPGLDKVIENCHNQNLFFTDDIAQAIKDCDIIFISVDTPTKRQGIGRGSLCDLSNWELATRSIAKHSISPKIVIEKSTVPVRTSDAVRQILSRSSEKMFAVLSNPEFMAEGTAIHDLQFPDRVLIGSNPSCPIDTFAAQCLINIYSNWVPREKIITSSIWSTELAKIASNALLAQRISSINAIAMLCDKVGADVREVSHAVGSDSRIGGTYLQASIGFGGSCLEKDLLSLVYLCNYYGLHSVADYWHHIKKINDLQKERFCRLIFESLFHTVRGKCIAIFGFSFKKQTSDIRMSPAIDLCGKLIYEGAILNIVDPQARESEIRDELTEWLSKRRLRDGDGPTATEMLEHHFFFQKDVLHAVTGSHAIVLLTDWEDFVYMDYWKFYSLMEKPCAVFDGRNCLDHEMLKRIGFNVYGVGVSLRSPLQSIESSTPAADHDLPNDDTSIFLSNTIPPSSVILEESIGSTTGATTNSNDDTALTTSSSSNGSLL